MVESGAASDDRSARLEYVGYSVEPFGCDVSALGHSGWARSRGGAGLAALGHGLGAVRYSSGARGGLGAVRYSSGAGGGLERFGHSYGARRASTSHLFAFSGGTAT